MGKAERRTDYLICLAMIVAMLAVYWQVRGFGFILLDDPGYVSGNGHVLGGLNSSSLSWAFRSYYQSNWHPLTWISLMADAQLGGANPAVFHLTNVGLHILNTLLLFAFLLLETGKRWASASVALLFAIHPLHVESVAWVTERKDVLSTLFWLLTMLAYLWYARRRSISRYLLVATAFALGLLAKPMLVTLPIVLLLLDIWPLGRLAKRSQPAEGHLPLRALILEKIPLLAISAASCAVTLAAQSGGGSVYTVAALPIGARISNAVVACVGYIVKMLWPTNLMPQYPHPGRTLPEWQIVFSALLLALVTVLAVKAARKRPYVTVGWLWYLVTLIPVIGLVQVGVQAMADRYTYIPLLGVFIAIAWAVPDGLSLLFPRRLSIAPAVAGTVLLLALAVLSYHQIGAWTDRDSFISQMLVATHNHPLCRALEANLLNQAGEPEEALRKMEELARDCPRLPEAHMGLGCTLGALRQYDRAIVELNEAIRLRPEYAEAYCHLGEVCESAGRYEEALQYARKAVDMAPDVAQYHATLAHVLATLNRPEEAISEYEAALAIQPDVPNADRPLGVLLFNTGDLTGSIEHLQIATSSNPDDPMNHYDLGIALRHTGDNSRAIEHLTEAIRLRPTWADAHGQLAMALDAAGERQRAIEELELARRYGAKVVTPSGN